jgi:receptor protein-tyrosine kinase
MRVLRERWWLVVVCAAVGLVLSLAIALHAVKQYTATATLLVRPSNLPALIDPSQQQATDSASLARVQSDDVSLIASATVAAQVKQLLHTSESVSDLQDEVSATPQASNDLIDVSVTDPDPAKAATRANAFATATAGYLTELAKAQLISGQAQLQTELDQASASDPGRAELAQALKEVIALEAVTNGGVQVVDTAQTPSSPSSASAKREAVIGGAAGLVIGLALAFLLDLFDRRIKSPDELEQLYGYPALTSVPLRRREPASEREAQADLEPFRILRDGLASISLRKDTRVILVTSAVPGEGKTSVATGLARAIASANRAVALVEVDIHRPAVKRQFGLQSNGRGLMNALVDGSSALELLQPAPGLQSLSVLPSGPFTPVSAELLRLPALSNVLRELAQAREFVILDGPPLLPVADAQVLLDNDLIDAVLLVARPYLTTRDQVRGALAVLKRHPPKGMGLVINGSRVTSSTYYHPAGVSNGRPAPRGRVSRLIGIKPQGGAAHE